MARRTQKRIVRILIGLEVVGIALMCTHSVIMAMGVILFTASMVFSHVEVEH